eukprot:TRINITY_DN10327_c0_g1_i1.p1 TRINITY_DN10327_c0_g1~~TRINITY_DN10327_c0_g1_i1.p1  ORF type:complete len:891 (-),score=167.92 TRINITY_DN10327_c0_g1_i1:34-2706(-)
MSLSYIENYVYFNEDMQRTLNFRGHMELQNLQYDEYVEELKNCFAHSIPIETRVLARVLAVSWARHDWELSQFLLKRSADPRVMNSVNVSVVLKAAKLVDAKRRMAAIKRKKIKKRPAHISVELRKLSYEEPSGSLTGSLCKWINKNWIRNIDVDVLSYSLEEKHQMKKWKQLISYLHTPSIYFKYPEFLNRINTQGRWEKQVQQEEFSKLDDLLAKGFILPAEYEKKKSILTGEENDNNFDDKTKVYQYEPKNCNWDMYDFSDQDRVNPPNPGHPFIIHGDMGHINTDIVVVKLGSFLEGYLGGAIEDYYGEDILPFLHKDLDVPDIKDVNIRKATRKFRRGDELVSVVEVEKVGGLSGSSTVYYDRETLQSKLPNTKPNSPHLLISIVGDKQYVPVTACSVEKTVRCMYNALAKECPVPEGETRTVAIPPFCFNSSTYHPKESRSKILKAQIKAILEGSIRYPQFVPIIVCPSDDLHKLCLYARSETVDTPTYGILENEDSSVFKELVSHLDAKRLVTFVGAGLSMNSGLPSWKDLINYMASKAHIHPPTDDSDSFLYTAQDIKSQLGNAFGGTLKDGLGYTTSSRPNPSVTHYLLSRLSTSHVITTNYDLLIEDTYRYLKTPGFVVSKSSDVAKVPISSVHTNILKIHGDINDPDNVVFTHEDYDNYFEERPAVSTLLKGLLFNRSFLFLGYSLRDPNLHSLMDEVSSVLKDAQRHCYAIIFEGGENEIRNWKEKGLQVIKLKGDSVQQKIYSLWRFLDVLQQSCQKNIGAWLSDENRDFIPTTLPRKTEQTINRLRDTLKELSDQMDDPQVADFVFPWLLLGTEMGLSLATNKWDSIAEVMRSKGRGESESLDYLSSLVAGLQMSCGKGEQPYLDAIDELIKDRFV